jgi:MoaA/NifB/PqqE/SkfB family radical SAM enzyme
MSIAQEVNQAAAAKNIPLSAFIDLTWRCNLGCYYCYQQNYPHVTELSTAAWLAIFEELARSGCLYVTFSGGEPLLRDDFAALVRGVRATGCGLSLITNGTRLSPAHVALFDEVGIMDVGVSLLAADGQLHDQLCGVPGSFANVRKALQMLREAGIRTIIKHSVSAANFGHYRRLGELADELGALLECDSLVLPSVNGTVSAFSLSPAQQAQVLSELYPEPQTPPSPPPSLDWNLRCDAGRSLCGITPDGELLPCSLVPLSFGNLAASPFEQAEFRRQEACVASACLDCAHASTCSRCYGVAARETGHWQACSRSLCSRAEALGKCESVKV